MIGTVAGFVLYSPAPLGGDYEASLYEVTDHHRLARQIIRSIPEEASVATQARYVPHLAHREHVYHYPWIDAGVENMDYILLDRHSNPYPFSQDELNARIDELLADPGLPIRLEADGIYLFEMGRKTDYLDYVVDDSMQLVSADVTAQDERKILCSPCQGDLHLDPGDQVRVSLHWSAIEAPQAERTVSLRIVAADGAIVAQHDGWPALGTKPTSWWEKGWQVRDVHYLTVSEGAAPGPASLQLLVYDSYSYEVLPFEEGQTEIEILPLTIGS
jgi:hypothetical protein